MKYQRFKTFPLNLFRESLTCNVEFKTFIFLILRLCVFKRRELQSKTLSATIKRQKVETASYIKYYLRGRKKYGVTCFHVLTR